MRFYMLGWQDCLNFAASRLKIGPHCVICARRGMVGAAGSGLGTDDIDLCEDCESLLRRCVHADPTGRISHLCLVCGAELPGAVSTGSSCCDLDTNPFLRIVAPYRYEFPVDRMVHALKYRDQRPLARVLGSLLADAVCASRPAGASLPSLLVPVPLHASRLHARGFNQSADIARWCARTLGLDSGAQAAVREFDTGSLAGLSRLERQHRILGAFRADAGVAGRQVAIVDDVLTTGSTARELARELYDTGAVSVELWVLARTSSAR
jgi:ComF family protein